MTIMKLNENIIKTRDFVGIMKYFKNDLQCSDISHFPDDFNLYKSNS